MAVVTAVSGRTLSREIASPDEISRSREISMSDEMRSRCPPVPHDVLWLRLNIAPRLPENYDNELAQTLPTYRILESTDHKPEVDVDFRSQDGGQHRRYRRDVQEERQRRRRRRPTRRQRQRRRHSRKHSRQRDLLAKLSSDGGAWQCHMTSHWVRMADDVFPPYIKTGNCSQSRCMKGLYECRARKYATRLLRRLPGRCNPVPVTGGDVTAGAGFEEAWVTEEYHVTVGCECSKRRTSGRYDDE